MLRNNTILEQLSADHIVDAFIQSIQEIFEDFSAIRKRYLNAMDLLQQAFGDAASPSCHDEKEAIARQTQFSLLFSGILGLKTNLDNFYNPAAQSFLALDSEVYLREETVRNLPEYKNAQEIRNSFYGQLSPQQQKIYEDVIEYSCYLETVCPKLAHFYGYMMGNALLPYITPGYHPDENQTSQYIEALRQYLGDDINRFLLRHNR